MSNIKIMHISQAVSGGVEQYIKMLLKRLDKNRFDNILVCSNECSEKDYTNLLYAFEKVNFQREIGTHDLKSINDIRKLIKKYNPDIIYAHSSKAGAIARVANIGLNKKCIYNPHGWAFNMNCSDKKKKLYIAIEKLAANFCDKIICISEAEKQSALKNKICKETKLKVIMNGIDIEAYEKQESGIVKRSDLKIPDDAFVVGMTGRISQQKAPDTFIRSAKLIKEKIPSAHFIIVGNGDMESEIKQYAAENGLSDSLHITGWVSNPMNYVELFDVACLLSRWEGFGLVLPEYMLAHKPIVATEVDAIPTIIENGRNGLLVPVDDEKNVCEAVLKIHNSCELKEKLIQNGISDVYSKFDIRRVADEHMAIFNSIC